MCRDSFLIQSRLNGLNHSLVKLVQQETLVVSKPWTLTTFVLTPAHILQHAEAETRQQETRVGLLDNDTDGVPGKTLYSAKKDLFPSRVSTA
ncbi:hypothetical protein BaRGS_00001748 [Batillaria attramentaria]|uniref:Uncharacterized protein n=1 Tax=Batillaria attramentaria TaxID=370345 RepID=A0ABD0M5H4_9CAEN